MFVALTNRWAFCLPFFVKAIDKEGKISYNQFVSLYAVLGGPT